VTSVHGLKSKPEKLNGTERLVRRNCSSETADPDSPLKKTKIRTSAIARKTKTFIIINRVTGFPLLIFD
jgi:hypothetical protein